MCCTVRQHFTAENPRQSRSERDVIAAAAAAADAVICTTEAARRPVTG